MAISTAYKQWNKVFSKRHLKNLFEKKIRGKSSVGLDWVSVENFEKTLDESIDIILRKCNESDYNFTQYREMLISKGAGKAPRCISIPTVRDKLVFSALNEILTSVYGNAATTPMPQMIIKELVTTLQYPCIDSFIKTDIKTFYASINHEILLKQLHKKIRKTEICEMVEKAISTNTAQPNALSKPAPKAIGVPEGLSISNILANIYMQLIDKKYNSLTNCVYWRYVDDILILTSNEHAEELKKSIISDVNSLKLDVSKEKTFLGRTSDGFEFLGYFILPSKVSVRQSSIINLERTIEMLFRGFRVSQNQNADYLQWKINLKVTGFILDNHKYGWLFFYSQIDDLTCLSHLDWLVISLCKRFNVENIRFKSFLRAYNEISKALHSTTYIPNLDRMTIEEKRHIVRDIYNESVKDADDSFVEMRFRKIMSKEIRDIQKDVQPFS